MLLHVQTTAEAEKRFQLNVFDSKSVSLSPKDGDTSIVFEVNSPQEQQHKLSPFISIFFRLAVDISGENTDGSLYRFPFHSIRGISSDDSHSHFNKLFQSMMRKVRPSTSTSTVHIEEQPELAANPILVTQASIVSNFIRNFIRDIFSSCPSPLFGHSHRHHCIMSLSPYGTASISIQPQNRDSIVVQASARYEFMPQYLFYILIAVLFLLFSDQFSKSKIFQYCCGMITFISLGLVLIVLSLTGTVKPKSTIIQNMSLFTLLTSTYGATLVYFLRSYLSVLLVEFWEFTVCYVLIFSCFGAWVVHYIRSNQHTKHVFRVSVKWMIRSIGLYLLFNASASPTVSWTYMLLFVSVYTVYETTKRAVGIRKRD